MGHIELAAPVSHIWYFKGIPSRMGLIARYLPAAAWKRCCTLHPISLPIRATRRLRKNSFLTEKEYRDMREKYEDEFEAVMGAEAIKKLLQEIDLEQLSARA